MDLSTGDSVDDNFINELSKYFPPGTSQEDMLAMYNNPDVFEDYMNQIQLQYNELQQNYSVYNECVVPVATQGWESIWQLLLFCLILRVLYLVKLPRCLLNICSVLLGCLSLWKFYDQSMIYVLVPTLVLLSYIKLRNLNNGLVVSFIVAVYLLACEFFLLNAVDWNKIKGSIMVISMKIISVTFDVENGILTEQLSSLEFYGYVFNPASLIFGPFISYKDYEQLFHASPMSLSWLFHSSKSLLLGVACLLFSSCGTSHYLRKLNDYIPQLEDNRWWIAYKEALTFRFSHYFVSYISESTCLLVGIGTIANSGGKAVSTNAQTKANKEEKNGKKLKQKDEHKNSNENIKHDNPVIWSRPIANMLTVEFPRSLVDVVTNWNLPMHYWLKQYMFKSFRKYGVFAAILFTYVASSMLHSLNFQLSAVLLSIGVFAYIESVFRHTLACGFNACIEARRCKQDCKHKYRKWNFWVISVNLLFGFVAVWNLAYLGCLFDNSAEEDQGYSMAHALKKWKNYNFINHLIMMATFVLQALINRGSVY